MQKHGVEIEYVTDEGRNADSFLLNECIKVSFEKGTYSVEINDSVWKSTSNNFIDETVKYITGDIMFEKNNAVVTSLITN